MPRATIRILLPAVGIATMFASSTTAAQPLPRETTSDASPAATEQRTVDVARVVRARVPWTWLLKDPDRATAVLTRDQRAQAETMVRLAEMARRSRYDNDPRYVRLRVAMEDAALAEIARLHLEKRIEITPAMRQARLAAHPGRYDEFRLHHIFIGPVDSRTGAKRTAQEALAMARDIERRLRNGESFEVLAQTHSDDRETAAQGGELSMLTGANMGPVFLQALKGAAAGTITPPVEGNGGFHLIRLDERIVGTAGSAATQIDEDIVAERLPVLIDQAVAGTERQR